MHFTSSIEGFGSFVSDVTTSDATKGPQSSINPASSSSKARSDVARDNAIFLRERLDNLKKSHKCFLNSQTKNQKTTAEVARFAGKDVSQLLCIEIYAGTARLPRAMKDVGLQDPCSRQDNVAN